MTLLRPRQRKGVVFVRIFITLSSHPEFHWTFGYRSLQAIVQISFYSTGPQLA
jgi:hypothetical protein